MSDAAIFVAGLFTSLLLFGGLGFTILEVKRIERKTATKMDGSKPRTLELKL